MSHRGFLQVRCLADICPHTYRQHW